MRIKHLIEALQKHNPEACVTMMHKSGAKIPLTIVKDSKSGDIEIAALVL